MHANTTVMAAIAAALASAAFAGWEDTGAPARKTGASAPQITVAEPAPVSNGWQAPVGAQPAGRPAQQTRPASRPASASFEGGAPGGKPIYNDDSIYNASRPEFAFAPGDDLYSPFLDSPVESEHWYRVDYVTDAEADEDGLHQISSLEVDLHFLLAEYRDVLGGDLSMKIDPSFTVFTEDGQYKILPALLLDVPFDIQWVWRFVNAWSLEVGAAPGLYGDLEAMGFDMFGLPLRGCLYYALNPMLSFRAGVEARPGWDRVVMPLVGLAWEPNDIFRLELGVPQSVVDISLGRVGLYGKAEWKNATYAMSGEDDDPDDITMDYWRVGTGLSFHFTEDVSAAIELGLITGREFKANGGYGSDSLDLDDTFYFGFVVGSQF